MFFTPFYPLLVQISTHEFNRLKPTLPILPGAHENKIVEETKKNPEKKRTKINKISRERPRKLDFSQNPPLTAPVDFTFEIERINPVLSYLRLPSPHP